MSQNAFKCPEGAISFYSYYISKSRFGNNFTHSAHPTHCCCAAALMALQNSAWFCRLLVPVSVFRNLWHLPAYNLNLNRLKIAHCDVNKVPMAIQTSRTRIQDLQRPPQFWRVWPRDRAAPRKEQHESLFTPPTPNLQPSRQLRSRPADPFLSIAQAARPAPAQGRSQRLLLRRTAQPTSADWMRAMRARSRAAACRAPTHRSRSAVVCAARM